MVHDPEAPASGVAMCVGSVMSNSRSSALPRDDPASFFTAHDAHVRWQWPQHGWPAISVEHLTWQTSAPHGRCGHCEQPVSLDIPHDCILKLLTLAQANERAVVWSMLGHALCSSSEQGAKRCHCGQL